MIRKINAQRPAGWITPLPHRPAAGGERWQEDGGRAEQDGKKEDSAGVTALRCGLILRRRTMGPDGNPK